MKTGGSCLYRIILKIRITLVLYPLKVLLAIPTSVVPQGFFQYCDPAEITRSLETAGVKDQNTRNAVLCLRDPTRSSRLKVNEE